MGQTNTFDAYVIRRLDHWGDEYALHRDAEWLGHARKNILQVLMEHKGMPGRATGFKPIVYDALAQQIEEIVSGLKSDGAAIPWVMRGYYCGRGRRSVERYETALMLLKNAGEPPITLRNYNALRKVGDRLVADRLLAVARAA